MTEPYVHPARHCEQYTPGHAVHWIQMRLTWSKPVARTPVEIVDVDDTYALVLVDDGLRRFQNHDLGRLDMLAFLHGPHAELVGYHALRFAGGTILCVKEDVEGPLGPCRR